MNRIIANHFDEIASRIESLKENNWYYRSKSFRESAKILRKSQMQITKPEDVYMVFGDARQRAREVAIEFIENQGRTQYNEQMAPQTPQIKVKVYNPEDMYKISFKEYLLTIHGFNNVTVNDFINIRGYTNLNQIYNSQYATNAMRLGIYWREHLAQKIPRSEIDQINRVLSRKWRSIRGLHYEIAGSYRRGLPESGDIDVIVHVPPGVTLDELYGMLGHYIVGRFNTEGIISSNAIFRLDHRHWARQIDIKITTPTQWPFALLYFTGSKEFNIKFRSHVKRMGMTINEHRMMMLNTNQVIPASTEEEIFWLVGLKYIPPYNRTADAVLQNR